ncbi:MAG: dihydrofolate reductase [Planctomycetota bacterium]|jgi:dihydrofolate reductase
MIVSIIVAMSENRIIGREGGLPWRLPADLARFKQLTTGHHVVMGRRTWETLSGPLPVRTNVVVTRQRDYRAEGAIITHNLEGALQEAGNAGDAEVFIAGGSEIYADALPLADRLYLTLVHASVEGDTTFPEYDEAAWKLIEEERHEADERHEHAFTFRTYERA